MRVVWDGIADRVYTAGVDHGMLYPDTLGGVPWSGLISVTEHGDPDQEASYFDGQRYYSRPLGNTFSGVISAYTYPDEFEPYIGMSGITTAQPRRPFGFSYRTNKEWHLVYNALAAPSQQEYQTVSGQVNLLALEWDFTTQPVKIPGGKPTAHVVILLDDASPDAIADLESLMYGTDDTPGYDPDDPTSGTPGTEPVLPEIADVLEIFESHTTLRITDNGDGTWTATGPDAVITVNADDTFEIDSDSAIFISDTTYRISSL